MAATIVVEDGSGVATANSYLNVADWKVYADNQGWDYSAFTDPQITTALIRAAKAIDAWLNWFGVRAYGRNQGLQWPRKSGSIVNGEFVADPYLATVVDREGIAIPVNEIPLAIKSAQSEAAWRELQSPGSMQPDLERGGSIKRVKAGSVEIEYADSASAGTNFNSISALLDTLIPELGYDNNAAMQSLLRA
jgi:hypothetical protein